MYGYYKEKSHVNHFWASGSFNRIWRCYENVVSGHLTSADQEFYHDNSIEAMKTKKQFYWSISGNTTVLRHLRVFPVVCGRCDVFRPIYNFRCNCSVLGVFIIKLVATTSVFAVTIEQQEINRKQVIAFFVSPTFPFAATSNTPTGCNNTSLSHVLTPSIYHKSHTITEHISVSRTTRSSLKYP